VLPYLFDFFSPTVPPAVRDEILTPELLHPRRVYGYAALYRLLERLGALPVESPSRPLTRHGRGEAEAIALAEERGRWLLVNDARPFLDAERRGVQVLSVPSFIGYLYEDGLLSLRSTETKLRAIRPLTGPLILRPAQEEIARIAAGRRERD
jgi:hypothetical protein